MQAYPPLGPRRRGLMAVVGAVASASLLSGVLMLFHVETVAPWAGLEASTAGVDPSCAVPSTGGQACQRRVARTDGRPQPTGRNG